jgi:hypothetical protein
MSEIKTLKEFDGDERDVTVPKEVDLAGKNTIVYCNISNGYVIRALYEYLHGSLSTVPLIFTEDSIIIKRSNNANSMFIFAKIDGSELYQYYNNSRSQYHIVNVNFQEFYGALHSIGKKESFCLYQLKDQPDRLFCKISGGNKNTHSVFSFKTEPYNDQYFKIEPSGNPMYTTKVPLSNFCNAVSGIVKNKQSHISFRCYEDGFEIVSSNATKTSTKDVKWGSCSGKCYVTEISPDKAKCLEKMKNFNDGGVVHLSSNADGIVKLSTSLSCFGKVGTFLVDFQE